MTFTTTHFTLVVEQNAAETTVTTTLTSAITQLSESPDSPTLLKIRTPALTNLIVAKLK
jgi:hypothetical protein